jgi:hypothetical protein
MDVNYIRHLSAFFEKISGDTRLNPSHVSLYMALFQFWNLNRFENPVSVSRNQVMKLSKIGSNHTYHKCLNDLHAFGYIQYEPSHNPFRGSMVYLCIFGTSTEQVLHNISGKIGTSSEQALHPSINNINIINNKTCEEENSQDQNLKNPEMGKNNNYAENETQNPEISKSQIPPSLGQVLDFFEKENYPGVEARKFFNHFQSNGWKVGGKSPMVDWTAAAHNWMLNTGKFSTPAKPYSSNLNIPKNYGEPL